MRNWTWCLLLAGWCLGCMHLGAQTIILENFNTAMPPSWTIVDGGTSTHTWARTTNGYNGNTLNGTQFAFVNSDAAGNAPHPTLSEQLITPTFDGTLYTQVWLEWDQYYRVYSTDRGYVEVWNGTAWVTLLTISANSGGWNAPNHQLFNITPYINPAMKVRFRYEDNAVWAWWWAVDNVRIFAPAAHDADLNAVILPTSQCGYSASEAITVTGQNNGTATINALPLRYRVNGGPIVSETMATPIAPGAQFSYTFVTTANLNAGGVYTVDAWAALGTDPVPTNDSLFGTQTTNHVRVATFPYIEDFEASQGGWFVTGTLPSWAWGTPAKNTIQGASSGQGAWVTGGLGTTSHGNNEDNHVEGPCLDFSSTSAPWVGLDVWWNAEFSWDGANLQTSLDSGATWVNVGQFGDPDNWYTDNSIDGAPGGEPEGWSGRASTGNGSNGWRRAVHSLAHLAGEPDVLVRVSFASDGSVVDDGFAFDNFNVARQPVMYLGPDVSACDSATLDAGPAATWDWSTGDSTRLVVVTQSGSYTATIRDSFGFPATDIILVSIEGPRTWDLGPDTVLCIANSYSLAAGPGQQGYAWNTGDNTLGIVATASGMYSVTTTSSAGCVRSDSVHLTFSEVEASIGMLATPICRGVPISFQDNSLGNPTSWYWDFGNGNLSVNQNPTTVFTAGGTFVLSLTVGDGLCEDDTSMTVLVEVCTGTESELGGLLTVWPNPTLGNAVLGGLSQINGPLVVQLSDLAGRVLWRHQLPQDLREDQLELGLDVLPVGLYLLQVEAGESRWETRIVRQ